MGGGKLTTRTEEYTAMSRELFQKAVEALAEDDLVQASWNLWESAARIVEAVAERHGWPHQDERDLYRTVDRLTAETGDSRLTVLFAYASGLYENSFENWRSRGFVKQGVDRIREFMEKMEAL
jgi:hypothetical protein